MKLLTETEAKEVLVRLTEHFHFQTNKDLSDTILVRPIVSNPGYIKSNELIAQNVAEFIAWHAIHIHPLLNGFSGYNRLKFKFEL